MNSRTKGIIKTLSLCLLVSTVASVVKLMYGSSTHTLAFLADGIHSIFDSSATLVGIISVAMSNKPPDEGHPYGHQKFETLAAISIAVLLFMAAFEVGQMAYERMLEPETFPQFSRIGVFILLVTMGVNLSLGRLETKMAARLSSRFLASDALHNQSDFWITTAVLISLVSVRYRIAYVDAVVSLMIALYLVFLAFKLIRMNLNPLVDHSVLDPKLVEEVASSIKGVLHCHGIRSRGEDDHHFLDLNIHLAGNISLERAHEITHQVEARLKERFPGLADVVIHTEPHGHPPCSKK